MGSAAGKKMQKPASMPQSLPASLPNSLTNISFPAAPPGPHVVLGPPVPPKAWSRAQAESSSDQSDNEAMLRTGVYSYWAPNNNPVQWQRIDCNNRGGKHTPDHQPPRQNQPPQTP